MTTSLAVRPYAHADRDAWDAFVRDAKNSTFLFHRDYMEYHSARFEDMSLIVLQGSTIEAVLPANRLSATTVVSHGGLTYGGLVLRRESTLFEVLASFSAVLRWLMGHGVTDLLYRRIPSFYCTLPDGDVSYALFTLDALRDRVDTGVIVVQDDRIPPEARRRRAMRKADSFELRVGEGDFERFWRDVLEPNLASRHGVTPVHTFDEIQLLASRFPDNIRQFGVHAGSAMIAGVTIYETATVAHAQYIASTDEGRRSGALDYLFAWLLDERYRDKRYVSFGTSNEDEGRTINVGLLTWKEGFGARVHAHDHYRISTANYIRLDHVLQHGRLT